MNKKMTILITTAVVMFLTGCSQQTTNQIQPTPTTTPTQQTTKTISTQTTNNIPLEDSSMDNSLITYQNKQYGFEFQYPQKWKIDQERTTANTIVFDAGLGTESRESLTLINNDKKLTLEQWQENLVADTKVIDKQSYITVGGEKALFYSTTEFRTKGIIFNHGTNTYIISTQGAMIDKGVVSSFKFINNNNTTQTETKAPDLTENTPIPSTQITTPVTEKCNVYTYQDKFVQGLGKHCLDKITLKGIYFVATDQTSEIIPDWKDRMDDIFQKLKTFYESQFNNKITITIETPEIRYGDKNITEYSALYDSVFKQEIAKKLSSDYYTYYAVYYDSPKGAYGGATVLNSDFSLDDLKNNGSISINPSFWLKDDMLCKVPTKYGTSCMGYISSAHEFGHSIGIPHPWEIEINKDSKGKIINQEFHYSEQGNIMSYNSGSLLSSDANNLFGGYFIMNEQKQKMIVN